MNKRKDWKKIIVIFVKLGILVVLQREKDINFFVLDILNDSFTFNIILITSC